MTSPTRRYGRSSRSATGTAILLAAIITAALVGVGVSDFMRCVVKTIEQAWIAVLTVCLIVGLAFLMNYSGMAYTLGLGASSAGHAFVLLSPFLGWIAVFLSGSDTSGNALFGNLQVVAAKQLNLDPVLFAATNSSGGVMGKMISPQNIATGVSVTDLRGQEGVVFARTFWHSVDPDAAARRAGRAAAICLSRHHPALNRVGRRRAATPTRRPSPFGGRLQTTRTRRRGSYWTFAPM